MNQSYKVENRHSERGGAGVKFLLVVGFLFLVAHAGYQYIPVAYQGQSFKQDMETTVIKGITMPPSYGKPVDIIKKSLKQMVLNNQLPYETYVDVREKNNIVSARVYYQKIVPILPFGLYNYPYVFDNTATPSGFLTEQ